MVTAMSENPERVKIAPPKPVRRAVVRLPLQTLEALIGLPEGMRAVGIREDFIPMGIAVLVESPDLEPVDVGAIYPDLPPGAWYRHRFVDEDGKHWIRFEWEPDDG